MDNELRELLESIERRLMRLGGQRHPALVKDVEQVSDPWQGFFETCSECGLKLGESVGYCCQNTKCPTGLGPTMCRTK